MPEEDLQDQFLHRYWSDKLPIIVPTPERVEPMLAGTSRDRHEIVGQLQPTAHRGPWEFKVNKVALNAVMAGAKPGYFRVILALPARQSVCLQQPHLLRERGAQLRGAPARAEELRGRGSVASVFVRCCSTTLNLACVPDTGASMSGTWSRHRHGGAAVLLNPLAARQFVECRGFARKSELIRFIHEAGTMRPASTRTTSSCRITSVRTRRAASSCSPTWPKPVTTR